MDLDQRGDSVQRYRARSAFGRFFRNPRTDRLVLVQAPNPPLAVYLLASVLRQLTHAAGTTGTVIAVVATVALTWWAADEAARGESPFRRLLGVVVLLAVVVRVVMG